MYHGTSHTAYGSAQWPFSIYFLYLREENDLDDEMGKSIFERVPGLEEQHLIGRIHYFKSQGVDTTELQQRLEEIQLARQIQERQLAEAGKAQMKT